MAQVKYQGLIPTSPNPVYATNYTLSDAAVGKFISLQGSRKFYNPGIDLTLSAPNSGATPTTLIAVSNSSPSHQGAVIKSNTNGDTAFIGYPNTSWSGDNIPGLVSKDYLYEDHSNSDGHLLNEDSVHPNSSIRVLNVLTPGQYVFKCLGSGDSQWSTIQDFNFDFVFCLNVNGIELNMTNGVLGNAHAQYVGGTTGWFSEIFWTIDNYVSPAFTLKTGDYVQMYCKSIAAYKNCSATYNVTNLAFTIELTTSTAPTQTTFSNPLGLTDFNTSSINFYGGGRDTLVLQGTKLTNI